MRKAFLSLLLWLMLAGGAGSAVAQTPTDPYALLASHRFEDVATGIEALGQSGDARALKIVEALQSHRLLAGPNDVFISGISGLTDVRSGAASAVDVASLHPVRVNNRVRMALATAQAELLLAHGTQAQRLAAAADMLAHPNIAMLPVLNRALDDPANQGLRAALSSAHAAILLSPGAPVSDAGTQLEAVSIMRAQGGLTARSLLAQAAGLQSLTPQARTAAARAVASIDWRLKFWGYAQDLFYGVSLGSVLLLAAMGLAITFGVMGVINMAHGELMMVGAYTAFVVEREVAAYAPILAPFSLVLALPAAFFVSGGLGIVIERGLIRFLYGRPLETLLASWGVSLILQQAIRSIFGPTNVAVFTPSWLGGSFALGGIDVTTVRLAIFLFAIAVMAALTVVLRRTSLGLHMRAVTQNRRMAALMGIRTARVDALTFGLGSGIAGLAGVAISQIDNVSPNLGQGYIIDSFLVVVFGGVGNLWGTLAAALALGVGGKGLEPLIGAVSGKILLLVLVILFIQRHPRGMFPMRGRGIEQ